MQLADKEGSTEQSLLLPDVLLPDERLLVDALRSLEIKGPQHRLLLKKLRFDASEESLSKPQLVSLLEVRSTQLSNQTDVQHNAPSIMSFASSAMRCMHFSLQGALNSHSQSGTALQLSR